VTPRKPLSETAFAKAAGQSRRQVRKAIDLGEIRSVIFAGTRVIPASELDRYIKLVDPEPDPIDEVRKIFSVWA
jgi:hypothetical protein